MKSRYLLENYLKHDSLAQKIFFKQKISWDFPLSLNIEVTNNCNFNCSMCPRKKGNRGFGNMDFNLYKKIIEGIAKEGKKLYILTLIKDGEPLLHPRLFEMIRLAKEKGVAERVEIFTNGALLDAENGRALIESGLDVLNISVNAAFPATHEKITGTKTFSLVSKNVKNFMTLKKKMKAGNPLVVAKGVRLSFLKKKEINQFKKKWGQIVDQVVLSEVHNYGGGMKDLTTSEHSRRWPCLVLWFNPVINYDGKLTTCCANYLDNELIMGDIKKQTLKEIWQSKKYKKLRRDHLRGNLESWPACESCDYWTAFTDLGPWLSKKEHISGS